MTSLDIIILIVFAGAAFIGWWRGIFMQLSWLGGFLFAILLCRVGGHGLAQTIAGAGETPDYFDMVLARLILFIIGYVMVKVVCLFFKKVTHAVHLGFFDRLAGAAFSALQWLLVLSLALNLWLVIKPGYDFAAKSKCLDGKMELAVVKLAPAVLGWAFDDADENCDSAHSGETAPSDNN